MQTKVIQFGNSRGIIIPASLLTNLNLNVGDYLNIKTNNNKIVLEKAYEEIEIKLADVFARYEKEHGKIKEEIIREVDWGNPTGDEEW